jgi:hypothetical protein
MAKIEKKLDIGKPIVDLIVEAGMRRQGMRRRAQAAVSTADGKNIYTGDTAPEATAAASAAVGAFKASQDTSSSEVRQYITSLTEEEASRLVAEVLEFVGKRKPQTAIELERHLRQFFMAKQQREI